MVWYYGAAFLQSGIIRLVCPHCKEVQARWRKPKQTRYRCLRCKRYFTRPETDKVRKRPDRRR